MHARVLAMRTKSMASGRHWSSPQTERFQTRQEAKALPWRVPPSEYVRWKPFRHGCKDRYIIRMTSTYESYRSQGHWPVNNVQVEVHQARFFQREVQSCTHCIQVRCPYFWWDEDIGAWHTTFCTLGETWARIWCSPAKASEQFPEFGLISITFCQVKVPPTNFQSWLNLRKIIKNENTHISAAMGCTLTHYTW